MVKILADASLSTSSDDLTVGGTIELGHATDTTLSRSAAGKLAVEGVDVALISQIAPTGSVVMWMTATAPSGWLFLDGTTYNQSSYPDLAAVFGVTSGTFTVPDMRDRFAAGSSTITTWSNNGGSFAPNTANSTSHTHTTDIAHGHSDTIAVSTHGDHTHTVNPANTVSTSPSGTVTISYAGGANTATPGSSTHTHSTDIASTTSSAESTNLTHTVTGGVTSLGTTSVTSSSAGGTLTPKSTLLNFIIKT